MNSERNVGPSGCASNAWRISIVSSLIRDDRLQRRDERQHDLAAGLGLELAGASLSAGPEPLEQLAGGLAAVVALTLQKRLKALLAQTASVDHAGWFPRRSSRCRASTGVG